MTVAASGLRLLVAGVLAGCCDAAAHVRHASLAGSPSAAPTDPSKDGARSARGYIRDQDMICGGPTIWNMLTAGSSATSVQNIKWGHIEALAKAYISEQTSKAKDLRVQIEGLAALIAKKQLENVPEYTSAEQNSELIEAALGPDSFGGLDAARDSDCGSPRGKTRASRTAYKVSQQLLSSAAAGFFKDRRFRLDGDGFLEVCQRLLPARDERSYCERLCQSLKDEAQRISSDAVGETSGGASELLKRQRQKHYEMAKAESEVNDCTKAWEGLSHFGAEIEALKAAMDQRFGDLQKAEEALDDAQWTLEDLNENLAREMEVLEEALKAISAAENGKQQASAALQRAIDEEEALRQRTERLQALLGQERSDFEAAKSADKTVVDLVTAVSATMMKMDLFSTSGVVEPLKRIGFEAGLDLDEFFPADPATTDSAGILRVSVEKMHEYCVVTAKPAFDEVKGLAVDSTHRPLDLSPLCEFGEVGEIAADLNRAVVDRMDSVKEQILWVKSWLNPYRANEKMTRERAAELVKLGEPQGLQEIISVYHGTNFFQYLKNWRYKGPFLELIARLRGYMESLDTSAQRRDAEIEGLKAELARVLAARKKAAEELEQLAKAHAPGLSQRAEVAKAAATLKSQTAALEKELADLEAAVRKAQAQYEEAKRKLLKAHAEGTIAPPAGKASLTELRTQRREAQQLIALIERSLARRKRSYQDAQRLLTELRKSEFG